MALSSVDTEQSNQNINVESEEIEVDEQPQTTALVMSKPEQEGQRQKYECVEEFDAEKDLFKSQVPGAAELERETLVNLPYKRQAHRFKTELEPEDVRLVNELGQLTADQLMEYLRKIKDMACGLGQAQEDQCLRGKFMGVFKH